MYLYTYGMKHRRKGMKKRIARPVKVLNFLIREAWKIIWAYCMCLIYHKNILEMLTTVRIPVRNGTFKNIAELRICGDEQRKRRIRKR